MTDTAPVEVTQELLPCPFCGGEAQFQEEHRNHWRVVCMKCGIRHSHLVAGEVDPRPRLIRAWNTRTTHSPSETEASARNVYRLQMGGVRLCDALRRIANGCEGRIDKDSIPALIAAKALAHNEPDPKNWDAALSLPSDKTVELLREADGHLKQLADISGNLPWVAEITDLRARIDSHLGEMK